MKTYIEYWEGLNAGNDTHWHTATFAAAALVITMAIFWGCMLFDPRWTIIGGIKTLVSPLPVYAAHLGLFMWWGRGR